MNADETHKNVSSVPIAINPQTGMMRINSICRDGLKCLFSCFSSIVFSPYFCYNVGEVNWSWLHPEIHKFSMTGFLFLCLERSYLFVFEIFLLI